MGVCVSSSISEDVLRPDQVQDLQPARGPVWRLHQAQAPHQHTRATATGGAQKEQEQEECHGYQGQEHLSYCGGPGEEGEGCHQEGRVDYKYQLTYRLSIHAGYLHMMLRYALLLKQDNRRLQYLLSQAGRSGPLPTLNFMDAIELDMATSAPDVGALLMYDFYSPVSVPEDEEEEEEERGQRVQQREDEETQEGSGEYSIITELFAALSSN